MKKLHNWFIGDYLAKTDNVFERAKITLTYNFAIFFMVQAALMYVNLITNQLWYHFYLVSFGWLSMLFMLYILKTRQNIKLVARIWLFQFIIIGTGTMLVQGGGMDMMSGLWLVVELLFAYFTLGGRWATLAFIHVFISLILSIWNEKLHGKLFDLGVPADQKLPNEAIFTLIPFVLCIYIITRFVRTRAEAEKIVNDQKVLLEEKNKEITDSINYAQHIQKAILPSQEFIDKHLPDSFVVYQPKSIVSGDFYWVQEKDGIIYFAVCDCTGHGVPGAMMSVISQNILNRTVFTFGMKDPADILNRSSELMELTLAQGGGSMRDGMDIALCVLDTQTMKLNYAGANNPLYIISDNELKEFKATKAPIGRHEVKVSFTNNEILLKKGDVVYLFSDGMADQFGGPNEKKFKYKALKELLLQIYPKSKAEQKTAITSAFNAWKGNYEQVDDVCIMGLKI
ncbi:MAG: PP2C family protein-serine/threonine phosphatase [Bacteroidota bacterium]